MVLGNHTYEISRLSINIWEMRSFWGGGESREFQKNGYEKFIFNCYRTSKPNFESIKQHFDLGESGRVLSPSWGRRGGEIRKEDTRLQNALWYSVYIPNFNMNGQYLQKRKIRGGLTSLPKGGSGDEFRRKNKIILMLWYRVTCIPNFITIHQQWRKRQFGGFSPHEGAQGDKGY